MTNLPSTHLTVVIGQGEQGDRAVRVAAVADGGHMSIPHDWDGSQRLSWGVGVCHCVALPSGGGQLRAQCQVLLDLLTLGLVEVKLGVLQVGLYLRQKQIPGQIS